MRAAPRALNAVWVASAENVTVKIVRGVVCSRVYYSCSRGVA